MLPLTVINSAPGGAGKAVTPAAKVVFTGVDMELASKSPGAWAALPFLYQSPRFGFSRGEQRLITCAMAGTTDEEIAQTLRISVAAVRKTWRGIYDRVGALSPELIGKASPGNGQSAERGKEKKHHLLAYLRQHPEELRPISRKLLRDARAASDGNRAAQTPLHRQSPDESVA